MRGLFDAGAQRPDMVEAPVRDTLERHVVGVSRRHERQVRIAREQLVGDLSAHRAHGPVERELAHEQGVVQPCARDLIRCSEDGDCDGQIEAGTRFPHVAGREVHRDAAPGNRIARGTQGAADAAARLEDAGIGLPTTAMPGMPPDMETSTVTGQALTPRMQAACTANTPPLPDALIAHYPIRRRRHRCSTDCAEAGAQRHRDDVEANGEDREMIEHVTCGDARVAAPLALIDGDFGKDRYAVGIATPRLTSTSTTSSVPSSNMMRSASPSLQRYPLFESIEPAVLQIGASERLSQYADLLGVEAHRGIRDLHAGANDVVGRAARLVLRCFLDMVYSFHEMGGRSMRRGFRQGACRCLQNPFPQARRFKQESNTPNLSRRNDVAGMRLQRVGR